MSSDRVCRPTARLRPLGLLLAGLWTWLLVTTPPSGAVLAGAGQDVRRPAGWDDASHGQSAADYARVFATSRVHELRITIPSDSFAAMQKDLETVTVAGRGGMRGFGGGFAGLGGAQGRPGGPGGAPGGLPPALEGLAAACSERTQGAACSAEGITGQCNPFPPAGVPPPGVQVPPLVCMPSQPPAFAAGRGGRGRGGAINLTVRDPMYVPVSIEYEGKSWTKVGMRYKGNSSLAMAATSGNGKVPFRLDFDRYEDDFPETKNQRFHGFQKLTFSSNFGDDSQMREALASEIFRDRGVPAPRAAFYRVMVDTGGGPEYWGLYTMIEDPADGAMLRAQLGSDTGNLYKPDGPGADWTHFDREGFPKKTNEKAADFRDIESAIAALHAPRTDAATWRSRLEALVDVPLFLRWLAVNTAIQNWDVYGAMAHNYYLYGDPAQGGKLRWIPWDNNFALGAAPFGGGGFGGPPPGGGAPFGPPGGAPGGPGARGAGAGPAFFFGGGTDVLHRQVGESWPLIRRLLDDETYGRLYRTELARALDGLFSIDKATARVRELHAMIAPSVVGARGERAGHTTVSSPEAFERSADGPGGLLEVIKGRHEAIRTALAGTAPR